MNPEARCTVDLRDDLMAGNGDLQFTRSVSESDRFTPNLITPYTIVYTTIPYCYKSYNFNKNNAIIYTFCYCKSLFFTWNTYECVCICVCLNSNFPFRQRVNRTNNEYVDNFLCSFVLLHGSGWLIQVYAKIFSFVYCLTSTKNKV